MGPVLAGAGVAAVAGVSAVAGLAAAFSSTVFGALLLVKDAGVSSEPLRFCSSKIWIFCLTLSSSSSKSSFLRLVTRLPDLSRTLTLTTMRRTSDLKIGSWANNDAAISSRSGFVLFTFICVYLRLNYIRKRTVAVRLRMDPAAVG